MQLFVIWRRGPARREADHVTPLGTWKARMTSRPVLPQARRTSIVLRSGRHRQTARSMSGDPPVRSKSGDPPVRDKAGDPPVQSKSGDLPPVRRSKSGDPRGSRAWRSSCGADLRRVSLRRSRRGSDRRGEDSRTRTHHPTSLKQGPISVFRCII